MSEATRRAGSVEAIFVGAVAEAPLRSVEAIEVAPGGIAGDRYGEGAGTFWKPGKSGQDLTLVEAEAIEALAAEHGVRIEPVEARRNVLTRGIDLNALVGRRFMVGGVECRGDRLCDPCSHLERLTRPGVLAGLDGRGGLRADVISAGTVRVGDAVEPA